VESAVAEAVEGPEFAGLVEKDVSRRVDEGVRAQAEDRLWQAVLEACAILFWDTRTTCKTTRSVANGSAPAMSSEPIVVNALSTVVVSL
jgi:hypothetical protein